MRAVHFALSRRSPAVPRHAAPCLDPLPVLPPTVSLALALLAAGGCVAGSVYWLVVFWRIGRLLPKVPRVEEGLEEGSFEDRREASRVAAAEALPRVSVVVPAHNEARVIETCVEGLLAQDYPAERFEAILVLDRCSDATAEIARRTAAGDPRIRIVENESCPAEWAGKCHAAALGAAAARGDWLLFTDADVRFDRRLVRASVGTARRRGVELLSLMGRLSATRWFEWVLQPAAALSLMRMYPLDRANRAESPRAFANGQFMLFRRDAYEAIGGHAAVREDLLEDLAFARRMAALGRRVGVATASALMEVHMYPTLAAMQAGWRRIFIEACRREPARLRRYALRHASAALLAPAIVVAALLGVEAWLAGRVASGGALLGVAILATAAQSLALARAYRSMAMPLAALPGFAPGSLLLAHQLLRAASDLARRRPLRWGGRTYIVEPVGSRSA